MGTFVEASLGYHTHNAPAPALRAGIIGIHHNLAQGKHKPWRKDPSLRVQSRQSTSSFVLLKMHCLFSWKRHFEETIYYGDRPLGHRRVASRLAWPLQCSACCVPLPTALICSPTGLDEVWPRTGQWRCTGCLHHTGCLYHWSACGRVVSECSRLGSETSNWKHKHQGVCTAQSWQLWAGDQNLTKLWKMHPIWIHESSILVVNSGEKNIRGRVWKSLQGIKSCEGQWPHIDKVLSV